MIKAAESAGHDGGAGPQTAADHGGNGHSAAAPRVVRVRILRQDAPGEESYWERFEIPYVDNMNVISILQQVAAQAKSRDGRRVAPVAWDCNCLEEVCGSCTMLINGRTRMACSALVDKLLEESADEIELRPSARAAARGLSSRSRARGAGFARPAMAGTWRRPPRTLSIT